MEIDYSSAILVTMLVAWIRELYPAKAYLAASGSTLIGSIFRMVPECKSAMATGSVAQIKVSFVWLSSLSLGGKCNYGTGTEIDPVSTRMPELRSNRGIVVGRTDRFVR